MIGAILLGLLGAADGLDVVGIKKLAEAALLAISDVEFGYEGWIESPTFKMNRRAFYGSYLRGGPTKCKIATWYEQSAPGDRGEFNETTFGFNGKESWTLLRNKIHRNGRVDIRPPTKSESTVSAVRLEGSFERVFLLPQLVKQLSFKTFRVRMEPSSTGNSTAVVVTDASGNWEERFALDLLHSCNVVKYESRYRGRVAQIVDKIELREFGAAKGRVWLPARAEVADYALPPVNHDDVELAISNTPVTTEWYAITAGAFRSPSLAAMNAFDPPTGKELAIYDTAGKRTRPSTTARMTATEREAAIAAEMDRLEKEGRLGKSAARPGMDWRGLLPWLAGGLLLGAAGILAWRSKA